MHGSQFQMLWMGLAVGKGATLHADQQLLAELRMGRRQQHIADSEGGELIHGQPHLAPLQR